MSKQPTPIVWAIRGALLCGSTAALLGLAHLLGWLSRVQIDYLAN